MRSTAQRFDFPTRLLHSGRDGRDDRNMTMDGSALIGRTAECARLEQEIQKARGGHAAVLVLRGSQGLGKTALLDHAVSRASGFRIIRTRAVDSETQLSYAALQVLCAQLLDDAGQLPSVQRDALATAMGQLRGSDPDRFLLGLATLNLLAGAAGSRPLLCIIDDAQWLDQPSAQALAFVARRLESKPVVLVFAARNQGEGGALPGFGMSPSRDVSPQIGERLLQQVLALPPQSRQLLLTAAAEPLGDPGLLWRAAAELQLPRTAAGPLRSEGLLSLAPRVVFRCPLLRFAVHRLATDEERRYVHFALALATDPARDPDHHVWHLAHAADGPDEGLASELERLAPFARRRGGLPAAAAFLEQATMLTLHAGRLADRAIAAAEAKRAAGAHHDATRLLSTAEMYPLDDQRQGRLQRLRAHISSSGNPEILVEAAGRMQAVRPDLARTTYLEALAAAMATGRLQPAGRSAEIAEATLMAPR